MAQQILFDPLLSWPILYGLGALTLADPRGVDLARPARLALPAGGGRGAFGRAPEPVAADGGSRTPVGHRPRRRRCQREPASSDRPDQSQTALSELEAEIAALGMEMRLATVGDAPDNAGTLLMAELTRMLAEVPRARVAGAILVTDGKLHDAGLVPDMPAPIHALLTGREGDWDRRLVIETAPAFAIIGEEFQLQLRIEDQGAIPAGLAGRSEILIAIDGEEPRPFTVPVGETLNLPLTLEHAGQNVIQFIVPEADGELTDRNNAAVVQINGIRDRLRVLLVSGEPHPGQRTWRNLLKSDPSVDLVHFTILRPPTSRTACRCRNCR
jgi:hypothetical protein